MLYCSIEDAWGKPIGKQLEAFQNNDKDIKNLDSLENFQDVIKKKVNRNITI